MCALGATHREVAEFLKISEATLYTWKHQSPEFSEALKVGKDARAHFSSLLDAVENPLTP